MRKVKQTVDARGNSWYVRSGYYNKKAGKYFKGRAVAADFMALDTETANNHASVPQDLRTWMHSIQVVFGSGKNKQEYLFRDVWDFIDLLRILYDKYDLEPKDNDKLVKRVVIYIHNASYDLSYLIPYVRTLPNKQDDEYFTEGIIKGKNDILIWVWGGFEFRCSKYLSNRSLAKWAEDLQTTHQKQIGLLDYDKIIYPDTELTENENKYSMEDVWVLHECVEKQMDLFGDDLLTIPKTSTGYVRREFEDVCDKAYHVAVFEASRLTVAQYKMCHESYSGGYTHNNRQYKNVLIKVGDTVKYLNKKIKVENIGHADFKSHYPSQMRAKKFPMGKFHLVYNEADTDENMTIQDIIDRSHNHEFSTLSVIRFREAKIKDESISMPFMQVSKCFAYNGLGSVDVNKIVYGESCYVGRTLLDNGRVLSARGNWLMALDDYTLEILNDQYDMECDVVMVWQARNDYLPANIAAVVDKYFKAKSDLKNKGKELAKIYGENSEEYRESQVNLLVAKALLNAIYGCCATNPLRDEYSIGDNMDFPIMKDINSGNIGDGLNEYYENPKNCLPYQWGVWITAAARYELYEFIKVIGYEHVLYCDTDSIFYIKNDEIQKKINDLNTIKHKTAPCVILENGKEEYYDYFDGEDDLDAFKGLHSKCYGVVTKPYTDKQGNPVPAQLKLTIAGVSDRQLTEVKEDGTLVYTTREEELAGKETDPYKALDKLDNDVEFYKNAGMSALYIGAEGYGSDHTIEEFETDGHKYSTAGGCVLKKLEKKVIHTLKSEEEYFKIKSTISNLCDI